MSDPRETFTATKGKNLMSTDVEALDALAVLANLAGASPDDRHAARSELAAHFARLAGVADTDLEGMAGTVPAHVLATARGYLEHGGLSPLASSALRLADAEPELVGMHPRTRNRIAAGYLPDPRATIQST